MTEAQERGKEDHSCAGEHEEFAAVEPVDGDMVERRVDEEGMPEKGGRSDVNGKVESFPEMAAEANAGVRSDDDNGENVERDGAESAFKGLLRRVDRIGEVEEPVARGFDEEQDQRMNEGQEEREVAGPVVEAEVIEPTVRPRALRTVPKDHEGAEEHVESYGADCGEAEVGAQIQRRDAPWQHGLGIRSFRRVEHYAVRGSVCA